jgi:hypothetical protein
MGVDNLWSQTLHYNWLQKTTGKGHFPDVNLVLFICQLIVYLPILVKYFLKSH